jgi:hypothetical protein
MPIVQRFATIRNNSQYTQRLAMAEGSGRALNYV